MKGLAERLKEVIEEGKKDFPALGLDMVGILTGTTVTAVVVLEIYEDGFRGRIALGNLEANYPFVPFVKITKELVQHLIDGTAQKTESIN